MELRVGDFVEAVGQANAELTFSDGTVVGLRPGALMRMEDISPGIPAPGPATRRAHLVSGQVDFSAPRGREEERGTRLSTDGMDVDPEPDSAGALGLSERGQSEVRIVRGGAQVRGSSGPSRRVEANQAVRADAGGHLGSTISLPLPPKLVSPADGGRLDASRLELRWQAVEDASAYRIQLAEAPSFARPLLDENVEHVSVPLEGLTRGREYYWRVATARDAGDGVMLGQFSSSARFIVTVARDSVVPPPIEIEVLELRNRLLRLRGRTSPGATVTLDGSPVDVGPDGSFDEYITVEASGTREIRLVATDSAGRRRELVRTVGEP
jgi:hypothetical protein